MNDTDFDLLCQGLSAEEAKRIRKMLKEWCAGDENSFPVQLALLTRAQWRAAAGMPLALQKIVTALEAKLADQQKQMTASVKSMASVGDDKIRAFEETVAVHTVALEKVAVKNCDHLEETEKFAREIRKQMEQGLRESDRITKSFIDERHALEGARQRYENSMDWRETGLQLVAFILAVGIGFVMGWYYFCHPR